MWQSGLANILLSRAMFLYLFHRGLPLHWKLLTEHEGERSTAEVFTAATCWRKRILLHISVSHVWRHCGFLEDVSTNSWSLEENSGKTCTKSASYFTYDQARSSEIFLFFILFINNSVFVRTLPFAAAIEKQLRGRLGNICGRLRWIFSLLSLCISQNVVKRWLQNDINAWY